MNKFQNLVEEFDTIIIFRHLVGDGDALGSQFGLKAYLKDKYPEKDIYAVGDKENGFMHLFPSPDTIEDEVFDGALAIVVDTANEARIDDQRYKKCQKLIKVDHHLEVDKFGDLQIVDESAASAAEIVTKIIKEMENGKPILKEAAEFLYTGILSDTQSFSISSVSKSTFEMAMYLLESELDIVTLNQRLHEKTRAMYDFQTYLRTQINFTVHSMAYVTITNEMLDRFKISHKDAKESVGLMKNIQGVDIWALFIEQEGKQNIYDGSLRSTHLQVNDIAEKFGGGGHKCAAGVKNLDAKDLAKIIYFLDIKTM